MFKTLNNNLLDFFHNFLISHNSYCERFLLHIKTLIASKEYFVVICCCFFAEGQLSRASSDRCILNSITPSSQLHRMCVHSNDYPLNIR